MDMLVWLVGWMESITMDGAIMISMAPRVALGYMAWWMRVRLGPLGLDESDHESGKVESPSSRVEKLANAKNPIHDAPPLEKGPKVLAMISPTPGKIWW